MISSTDFGRFHWARPFYIKMYDPLKLKWSSLALKISNQTIETEQPERLKSKPAFVRISDFQFSDVDCMHRKKGPKLVPFEVN